MRVTPTEADMNHWIETFVPRATLWYWDDAQMPYSEFTPEIVARAQHRTHPVTSTIETVNTYHLWAKPEAVQAVIIDNGSWLESLAESDRGEVRRKQVELNRGLCVHRERFDHEGEHLAAATFDGKVVLDHTIWSSLPYDVQRRVIETELPLWDEAESHEIPDGTPPHIEGIANAFVQQEGINCLGVTAYAITSESEHLLQWLKPQPFLGILEESGYLQVGGTETMPGDVLVWQSDGEVVHAAYALTPDLLLNKNGQCSFNPIRILNHDQLGEYWDTFPRSVYRRA